VDLLKRSRDLRIAIDLALALLMEGGLPGFRDGLAVLRGFIEKFWDSVFPRLDPEDNNDPLERMNIISALSSPAGAYKDPMMFGKRVREAPLCKSGRLGAFSLRDIEAAGDGGQAQPSGGGAAPPDMALITAAFEDTPSDDLLATAQAVDEAVGHVRGIEDTLTSLVGAGRAPNLSGLRDDVLGKVRSAMRGFLAKRGLAAAGEGPAQGAPGKGGAAATGGALSGEVSSPQDVLAALEKVCQYYDRSEPSSPVPLLLRRAQRLVSKSYVQIVQDLTPEVWEQIRRLGGIDNPPPSV
jgi:type VI secretion system protein ImpA